MRLYIALLISFFMYPLIQAEAPSASAKPLLIRLRSLSSPEAMEIKQSYPGYVNFAGRSAGQAQRQKEVAKKSLKIALYTLESSIGLLLSFFSAALAKDLFTRGKIGSFDPVAMGVTGALGIPLSVHGLIRLYQELNISEQIKIVSALLKKQFNKKQSQFF